MLILSRRRKESLVIGDDITVTVLDVRGGSVRIGVDAPKLLRVLRKELLRAPQPHAREPEIGGLLRADLKELSS